MRNSIWTGSRGSCHHRENSSRLCPKETLLAPAAIGFLLDLIIGLSALAFGIEALIRKSRPVRGIILIIAGILISAITLVLFKAYFG